MPSISLPHVARDAAQRLARRLARRLAQRVALPVVLAALVGSLACAQEVAYAVGFVDRDGAPLEDVAFASGDVAYLHVEIRNRSDAPLEPDRFWVALPPVEGVRLIGNASTGYSFPDRLLGPDGEERMVDHDEPQDSTHLHGLSEPLAPGESTALTVRLSDGPSRPDRRRRWGRGPGCRPRW